MQAIMDAREELKDSPVASNETPEGRQKNRRVELVLVAAR